MWVTTWNAMVHRRPRARAHCVKSHRVSRGRFPSKARAMSKKATSGEREAHLGEPKPQDEGTRVVRGGSSRHTAAPHLPRWVLHRHRGPRVPRASGRGPEVVIGTRCGRAARRRRGRARPAHANVLYIYIKIKKPLTSHVNGKTPRFMFTKFI